MTQQSSRIEGGPPLPANVQELRPTDDRDGMVEPTSVAATPIVRQRVRRW
jgi:hypothetical protein